MIRTHHTIIYSGICPASSTDICCLRPDSIHTQTVTVYHHGSLPALSNHCSQVGCNMPPYRLSCVDAALPRPAVQHQAAAEFSLFSKRGCSFLGGPRHVSALRVCVNMCVSEGVCVIGSLCLVACTFCE